DLEPAALLAEPAARALTDEAEHVHLGGGFREREERRSEPRPRLRPEHLAREQLERALEIAHRDGAVHGEPFALLEHRRLRHVDGDAGEGVERAAGRTPSRQREVEPRARPPGAALRLEGLVQAPVQEGFELALGRVRRGADAWPLLGCEGAERAEELGQDALAAEEPDADLLELGGGLRGGDGLTRLLRDRVDARMTHELPALRLGGLGEL